MKLIQPYDSNTYTDEPEQLPAQWAPYWSKDPKNAKPFISLSTAPYMTGDCCTDAGHVYASKEDNNVWSPTDQPARWEDLGTIEDVMEV